MPPGEGDEALEVQLLEDDLRRIQALAGPGSDDLAPAERDELKRRETVAFLISMRARTIVSEMRIEALGRRAQVLERRHAERLRESAQMRRAIETLGRRIARLEAALRGGPPAPAHRPSLAARVARFLGRRHG